MKKGLIFSSIFLILFFFSCKKDNDEINPAYPDNVRFISEDVRSTTTWYSDTIYVIDDYDFYVAATLSIQAGTVIKFQSSAGPYMSLGSGGTIIANGTASNPIVFTSFKDDSHGGDTNIDGTATAPGAGDWSHINTNDENGSVFNFCEFYYGGSGSYNYTLTLFGSQNTTVSNCIFAHNRGGKEGDHYYGVLDASEAETGTNITNNIFFDNILPLSVSTSFNPDASNTFHNPDAVDETNTMNGIFVYAIDEISINLTWSETDVAYVINDNDLWINAGFSLSLGDDVVLKFTSGSYMVVDDGATINQGLNNFFTSFKDDANKGDTNGDGTLTSPAIGDWGGIFDNGAGIYYTWPNILYDLY